MFIARINRNTSPAENRRLYDAAPTKVRLKIPEGQTIGIDDKIRGRVEWQSDLMGDPIILRADGRALYNFATVVDDAGLGITHVIRAAEHLTNTAVQVVCCEALGYPLPVFAHVPVVNEPTIKGQASSKKKLSKRDMKKFVTPEIREKLRLIGWTDAEINARDDLNPATVAYYREMGYLPAALVNYLGRLGWSLDDKTEVMPLETMIANFGLERVNDSPASFDPEKLAWMAGEYMKLVPLAERVAGVLPFLVRAKLIEEPISDAMREKVTQIVAACAERIKIFSDILQYPYFFRDPVVDSALVEKRVKKPGMPETLRDFAVEIRSLEPFDAASLETKTKAFCEARGVKLGDLNHAVRVATTGVMIGPGVFDLLAILGRDESLRRIEAAL